MTPLFSWLQENAKRFAIRTFSVDMIGEVLPGYHACTMNLRVGSTWCTGSGEAKSRDVALAKAAGEAVERWLFEREKRRGRSTTTNGFAVHRSAGRARSNAVREIVERDLLLCHVLTGTPFNPLACEDHEELRIFRACLEAHRIELCLGELPSETGLHVIICGAFGHRVRPAFGAVIGLGCHARREEAITKALLECWGGLFSILCGMRHRPMSRSTFVRLRRSPRVEDHYRFALHADGRRAFRRMFRDTPAVTLAVAPTRPAVTTQVWAPLPAPFDTCPLVGVRCTGADLQPLFFGIAPDGAIRRERLERFCEARGLRLGRIRTDCIHPLA
jgi:ribosomal protein S12 methylthiotransferase accessory factor YcaO